MKYYKMISNSGSYRVRIGLIFHKSKSSDTYFCGDDFSYMCFISSEGEVFKELKVRRRL